MKKIILLIAITMLSCSKDDDIATIDIGISPAANADARSSYSYSKSNLRVRHSTLLNDYKGNSPIPISDGLLWGSIAYLDANGDGDTDIFMGTGEWLSYGEVDCVLFLNDGANNFTSSTAQFNGNMPPATHARKSIVSDFTNNGLKDILVLDHGFDNNPFPGNNPKLILQNSVGSFTWSKLMGQTGFHHGGAAADVDNDGDIDIFIGGFDPFFYINDGRGNFSKVDNRFDHSIEKVFTAELIDVDKDGYIDLLVGAHEQDGDNTSIYWGSNTGAYTMQLRTVIPEFANYGTVLDIDAEDFNNDGRRDLVINRTGGGNNNFYVGSKLQLLINNGNREFSDATNKIDNPGSDSDGWFSWLRAQDIDNDGDIDLFPDDEDALSGSYFINDGSGNFTKI